MSGLRRRVFGDRSSSEPLGDPSPTKSEPVTLVLDSHLKKLKSRKRWSRGVIFGLGGLFGVVIAAFFADRHDVINLEGFMDLNLESLLDVIPAGIINDAKDLTVRSIFGLCWLSDFYKLKLIRLP